MSADYSCPAHLYWRFIVVADYRKNSEYLGKNVRPLPLDFFFHKRSSILLADYLVYSRRTDRGRPFCVCQGLAEPA